VYLATVQLNNATAYCQSQASSQSYLSMFPTIKLLENSLCIGRRKSGARVGDLQPNSVFRTTRSYLYLRSLRRVPDSVFQEIHQHLMKKQFVR
jgi:hypothetical protein